ncbi:ImmA/IrrE family metallo-endopeptidase [Jonesiaceae bacterium BS-20]|uniref:ImmA/IrrE family metallo-endopeptidase n=1 Tax=Jonesiaceae bacterium BS-20 TaxID=3120821 RepID=A0AAU7DZP2_9MICO
MIDLITLARRQGFHVEFLPLAEYDGLLLSGGNILVDSGITERRQRETIAHELGYAYYGHSHGAEHDDEIYERQANSFAARLLVDPVEYAIAESLHPHPGAIAKELGVSQYLVELRQTQLQSV